MRGFNVMRPYIGSKIIKARPMSLEDFRRKIRDIEPATDEPEGYLVQYPDGYLSWSPKSVFEAAYRPLSKTEERLIVNDSTIKDGR